MKHPTAPAAAARNLSRAPLVPIHYRPTTAAALAALAIFAAIVATAATLA